MEPNAAEVAARLDALEAMIADRLDVVTAAGETFAQGIGHMTALAERLVALEDRMTALETAAGAFGEAMARFATVMQGVAAMAERGDGPVN